MFLHIKSNVAPRVPAGVPLHNCRFDTQASRLFLQPRFVDQSAPRGPEAGVPLHGGRLKTRPSRLFLPIRFVNQSAPRDPEASGPLHGNRLETTTSRLCFHPCFENPSAPLGPEAGGPLHLKQKLVAAARDTALIDEAVRRLKEVHGQTIVDDVETVRNIKAVARGSGSSIYTLFALIIYGPSIGSNDTEVEERVHMIREYLEYICPTPDPVMHIIYFMSTICESSIFTVERSNDSIRVIYQNVKWEKKSGGEFALPRNYNII